MNLESQVCSLELAKKLKALGVRQESEFYWVIGLDGKAYFSNGVGPMISEHFAAFTVAELGEMLPPYSRTYRNKGEKVWTAQSPEPITLKSGNTEADARAKMLVYLIEQGIVKP